MLHCKRKVLELLSTEIADAGIVGTGDIQLSTVVYVLIMGGMATFKDIVIELSGVTIVRVKDTLPMTA